MIELSGVFLLHSRKIRQINAVLWWFEILHNLQVLSFDEAEGGVTQVITGTSHSKIKVCFLS